MLTVSDHTDVGVLLSYALKPTQRPGRHPEYRRVLDRYRVDVDFRDATNAILHGLGMSALSDGAFGLILGVEADSPFAFRFSDMPNSQTRDGRLLAGLVLLAMAAWAYPSPAELDDDRVRRVPDIEFEAWLRETCERLQHRDAAGEIIPEDGLDQAWRVYTEMPSTLVGDRGRGSGRLSPKCTLYWVRTVLGWLEDHGMARPESVGTQSVWTLTERFRIQVKDWSSERVYTYLTAVARGDDPSRAIDPARETEVPA